MVAIDINGAQLRADPSGALLWSERGALVVADLHFEKGSGYAARGALLPPYDSHATAARLEVLVERHDPALVVCLGDSFHDGGADDRCTAEIRDRVRALTLGRDWVWIEGNHDPRPPEAWGGRVAPELVVGPLRFRHEAAPDAVGEVSGHFHPKARVQLDAGRHSGRCFIHDGRRLVMPAFGAYAGGLNVLDPAIRRLFASRFAVAVIGRRGVYAVPRDRLLPDPMGSEAWAAQ